MYSEDDIILSSPVTSDQTTNLTLFFDPIRTVDEDTYTCVAILFSSSLDTTLNSSASLDLTVQQSKILCGCHWVLKG